MPEGTYWSRRTVGRRTVLRGAGLGIAGMAGAALFGCGGADDAPEVVATSAAKKSAVAVVTPGGGKVSPDQVRVKPGTYESRAAHGAERDPIANAPLWRHAADALPRPAAHGLQPHAVVHDQHRRWTTRRTS